MATVGENNTNMKPKSKVKLPEKLGYVDYKNIRFLLQFVDRFGKIKPRKYTKISLQQQKKIAIGLKRARYMNLMPFVKKSA